ncbi:MAG: DNA polymerase III subunit chi [Woeseia sp.]|nr:DNA polymerase III subunit chi [Woeseia sp.]MBT8098004.1 DNA polymerase III subunit chi [Woeseia sp.]NNE60480.1 DNA polymerase III subunit chi [Woeseia sp.]NNL54524.1 DNA polymerase III subunit chi [Woeseia sp.]
MSRVDFYVLKAAGEASRWQFACRLTEKAYKLANTVYILAPDPATAERLDELLWTWHDGSFVPHEVGTGKSRAPVTLGSPDAKRPEKVDLLINLCDNIPEGVSAFPRVAEIVTSDDATRQASRVRFASYRDQGHSLETHNL